MYGNMANSTVGRVELEAEVERNWGAELGRSWGAESGENGNTAEFFFKAPPCLDINIHLDILI